MKTNDYNSSDSAAIPNATDLEDPKLPNTLCEELPFPQNAATNEHSRANRQPLSVDGESTNQAWVSSEFIEGCHSSVFPYSLWELKAGI